MGFKVQIPTSRCSGINIDTSWYRCNGRLPMKFESHTESNMRKYFEELDNGANWYKLARLRLDIGCEKWVLFLLWYLKYKWKDPHRDEWEEKFREMDARYESSLKSYYKEQEEIKSRSRKLVKEVLPVLNKFSNEYRKYDGIGNYYTVDKIIKLKHLEGE